jgi:hypothetical protein
MCAPNCNDQIAARAFGAICHYSPLEIAKYADECDAVFATMWKVRADFEPRWMDALHTLAGLGKKVVLFQEAETGWPLTRSWEEMKSFIELLGKVDLFLTHNTRDTHYWGRLASKSYRWRTCLDLSPIWRYTMDPDRKADRPILFGSSYDDRANGLAGLLAVKDLGHPLWHQNRSTGYMDRNKELPEVLGVKIDKEIPHDSWSDWLREVSGAYLAVHPMPAAAAGRDQIAFAALGIPCIGNGELEIQRELFGNLQISDIYNPKQIEDAVHWILNAPRDYATIREYAIHKVRQEYGLAAADYQAAEIKRKMGWL